VTASAVVRPHRLAAVALAAMLVAACRPAFVEPGQPDDSGGSPGAPPSAYPTDTPPPAYALKPATETNVQVRLFRAQGPADASLQYAQALDSYREVNLIVDLAPPIAGYDVFEVDPAAGIVTAWIGTIADVAAAPAGLDLVAVGEITGRDPTVVVRPTASGGAPIRDLAGPILAETTGAEASTQAALAAAGVATPPAMILPDDPAAPFDPTPLLDGTAASAAVSLYDGWARIQEAVAAAGSDPTSRTATPVRPQDGALLGELIWVRRADFADPDARAAINAFIGVVAQSQVACRDALEDCAGTVAAQSDRTPEGLAWSIDQLNRLLFPAPDGIVHIDPAAWERTVAAMRAANVPAVDGLTFTNDVVDTVAAAFGDRLDLTGASWTPPPEQPLIPPAAP
jgi:NitT/TauT family transport system substrate-binding protein